MTQSDRPTIIANSKRFATRVAPGLLAIASFFAAPKTAHADRLRDLCDVAGVRENQLVGYAIVTGLQGTGDDAQAPFAAQSLYALMRRLGIQIDEQLSKQVRLKNVAAVVVNTNIPAFARPGQKLDVTVTSVGNSKSLRGGVLLQGLLKGPDQKVYAVAQGALVLGGFEAKGASGSSSQTNITTTARIPAGALIEREIPTKFVDQGQVTLNLREADFRTAQRVVIAVDRDFGKGAATALDAGSIKIAIPGPFKAKTVEFLAKLQDIDVSPASVARIVINERTGTIVAGGDVRLSPVAIAHGGLSITVKEAPIVSQPTAGLLGGNAGTTQVVQRSEVKVEEAPNPPMRFVEGATSLADVANSLTALGVSVRELASILQALRAAGALRAEVVIQ